MQVWAQVNLSLHLDNTFLEIVLGNRDGCSFSSTASYFISWKKKKNKQSWKKIRSQFIAHKS